MTELLAKKFVKPDLCENESEVRRRYGVFLGGLGIFLNIVLFAIKLIAGIISGSVAIMADSFNNLSDSGSSLIQLIGYKLSGQKPDTNHPFGHGRLEYVSGLVISMFVIVMGAELMFSSVRKIIHPAETEYPGIVLLILVISVFVKLYMYTYNGKYADKLSSSVLRATAYDSLSDCVATSAVLLSAMASEYMHLEIDGYCGMLVSLFIIYTGITSAKDTLSPLLGQPADPEFIKKIAEFVMSYDEIYGIHDLIVHDYGSGRTMISLHAEVSADGDFIQIHDTIDNIEKRLMEVLGCHAVIHMDPIHAQDEETVRMRRLCELISKSIDESLTIHDFRMVTGPTHINVIFDVVVPYDVKMPPEKVKEAIAEKIESIPGNLRAVIDVDRPFC